MDFFIPISKRKLGLETKNRLPKSWISAPTFKGSYSLKAYKSFFIEAKRGDGMKNRTGDTRIPFG